MRLKFLVLLAIVTVTCWVGVAAADIVYYDISVPNSAISGYPGPYEKVEVDLTTSTTAIITFTSYKEGGNIYLMGDGSSAAVNVNATSWSVSNISGSNGGSGFTPGTFSNAGSGNVDGFGTFNQCIDDFDGFTHSVDTLSFTLTRTSGTWLSAANVLTANGHPGPDNTSGYYAAAHVYVTSAPAKACNGAIVTGYAGGDNLPYTGAVPIPPTALLLGTGLLGLVGLGWRRGRAG